MADFDHWRWEEPQQRILVAKYTTDEIREDAGWDEYSWSPISNAIKANIISCGQLSAPVVSAPDSAVRGDVLTVHVDPVDGANWYNLEVGRYDPEEYGVGESWNWPDYLFGEDYEEAGDWLLSTAGIEVLPGYQYYIRVTTYGYGYECNDSGFIYFDYSGAGPDSSVLSLSKSDILTGEEAGISIYAPGAQAVRICDGGADNIWNEQWGEYLTHYHVQYYAGEHEFHAYATYDGNEWEEIGVQTLSVGAPYEEIDSPPLHAPDTLMPGEDLEVSLDAVPNAGEYHLIVTSFGDWNWIYDEVKPNPDDASNVFFTVPAYIFGEDTPYRLEVWAHSGVKGYEQGHAYKDFVVCDTDSNITISVNGSTDSYQSFLTLEEFDVLITAPGATAVRFYNGWCWDYYPGDGASFRFSNGEEGQRAIYAQALYGVDIDWEEEDIDFFDWEGHGFEWGGTSNIIYMDYYSTDSFPEPEVTLSSDPLLIGDPLTVTLENLPSDLVEYGWRLYDQYGDTQLEDYGCTESSFTIEDTNFWMSEGEPLYLDVFYNGIMGKNGNRSTFDVNVTGTSKSIPQIMAPSEIGQGDLVNVKVMNLEAGDTYFGWLYWDGQILDFFNWDGVDTIQIPTWMIPAGDDCVLFVCHLGGNGYFNASTSQDIRASASDGFLPSFSLSADRYITNSVMRGSINWLDDSNLETFYLELANPSGDQWEEYWDVKEESYGWQWDDALRNAFPWSTAEVGSCALRVCVANRDGQKISNWSDWQYFEAIDKATVDVLPIIDLPDKVTEIKDEAFAGSGAEIVLVPGCVTKIGAYAFANCSGLVIVEFEDGEEIEMSDNAFESSDVLLFAPAWSPAWQWAYDRGMSLMSW